MNDQSITTPIDYSLNIIEAVKNNSFFSLLAQYSNRIRDREQLDKSKKELALELITEFTYLHVRVQNNMEGDIKKQANSIWYYYDSLNEKDFENTETLKKILEKGLEYADLLRYSGLDKLTQNIAEVMLDANDHNNANG